MPALEYIWEAPKKYNNSLEVYVVPPRGIVESSLYIFHVFKYSIYFVEKFHFGIMCHIKSFLLYNTGFI